jgi:hypothetical protein
VGDVKNLLRSLGGKFSIEQGVSGAYLLRTDGCFFEVCFPEAEGWFIINQGTQWQSEWRSSWAQNGGTFACIFLLVHAS